MNTSDIDHLIIISLKAVRHSVQSRDQSREAVLPPNPPHFDSGHCHCAVGTVTFENGKTVREIVVAIAMIDVDGAHIIKSRPGNICHGS